MKRLLEYDAETATATYHHYDDLTKETTIETVQSVDGLLKRNKELRDQGGKGHLNALAKRGIKASWMHAATVPNIIIHKWMAEEGINFFSPDPDQQKAVRRKLNSPEYAYLRTGTGRL